ncbi:hypothetical protein [Henriciella sp.]|uniref:hypothetical protein n=1 Tax=Henriciella sp. TaxID=1968823 RepID=UPI00262ACD5E|nr:hypothetical protein [Henriciella sp.]
MTLAFLISLYLTIGLFDLMARGLWIGIDDKGVIPGVVATAAMFIYAAFWPVRLIKSIWEAL